MLRLDLKKIPSVDALLRSEEGRKLVEEFGRRPAVEGIRHVLAGLRAEMARAKKLKEKDLFLEKEFAEPDRVGAAQAAEPSGEDISSGTSRTENAPQETDFSIASLMEVVRDYLCSKAAPSLRNAVNATGIIIHTGLGRAVLSDDARRRIADTLGGYCTLAVDPETGKRRDRDAHLNGLLCRLTGAEASTVVNNNAAATVLILNTLAKNREVIVSRGQLVEIGGSFRMPDVMATSGAILREVGTTNKTHLRDYAEAISERTAAILRVHHSNYRIVGFAEEPGVEELIALGKKHNIPVIDDLGSGALIKLSRFNLEPEPLVEQSIRAGADVVCFSGDKLIGGPQSGIVVGKKDAIERIKKNPLKRAFRVGKMTIAGLEATLELFLDPETITERHPIYRMMSLSLAELGRRARRCERKLKERIGEAAEIEVADGGTEVGSGSVPAQTLPTKLLSIRPRSMPPEELAKRLRLGSPPVFTRLHRDSVLFDFRTIQPDEDALVADAVLLILSRP